MFDSSTVRSSLRTSISSTNLNGFLRSPQVQTKLSEFCAHCTQGLNNHAYRNLPSEGLFTIMTTMIRPTKIPRRLKAERRVSTRSRNKGRSQSTIQLSVPQKGTRRSTDWPSENPTFIKSSVRSGPGQSALTRIPSFAWITASSRVRASTAPLLAV